MTIILIFMWNVSVSFVNMHWLEMVLLDLIVIWCVC